MALKRLLDTNAYVAMRRGEASVTACVRDSESLVFSLFVVGELMFGFRNGNRYQKNVAELEAFLEQPDVTLALPTWATSDRYGRISAALRKAGTPIPTNDIWIAAHAFETGAELITLDQHFECIPGLPVVTLV